MCRISLLLLLSVVVQIANAQRKEAFHTVDYIRALKHNTDVMVNDVTSPVAASRYYAYITLSANETVCQFNPQQQRVPVKLAHLAIPSIPPEVLQAAHPSLAVIMTVYQAGVRFLPSGYMLKSKLDSLKTVAAKRNISQQKIAASIEVANAVVNAAINYSHTDGFAKLSGFRRYTPVTGDEYWQPTAPGFMAPVEPFWNTLRPFLIDSVSQFKIAPPTPYSSDTTSEFYRQMMEVYSITSQLDEEKTKVAMYWDCNPFALQQIGHLEFGIKKISPGGHWLGITGIACRKAHYDIPRTALAHSLISAAMADAFISCWNTKYIYNRIRPETAINRLVDKNWRPLLQTPPFPEYTSGHSVVSTVSAAVLTELFGKNFAFTDDTEREFGLPKRRFPSFDYAAKEAAISRLYGGIHYRDAIENGQKEGQQLASIIINKYKSGFKSLP